MIGYIYILVIITNTLCYKVLSRFIYRNEINNNKRDHWLFTNIVCSLIHSVISSCWTLGCIYDKPEFLSNLIDTESNIASYLIASSIGYFLYDTLDIIFNDGLTQWILLVHHSIILVAFPFCIITSSYQGFAICSLLMEFSSIFLHLRKLMKLKRMDSSVYYRLNSIPLAITMILFRIMLALYVTYYLFINRHKIAALPFTIGLSGAFILIPTNIGLCYRVFVSDFNKRKKM